MVKYDGVQHTVAIQCLSDWFWQRAIAQDAIIQPPFLEDPEVILQDEVGFNEWRVRKSGLLINLLEQWFRERTGIIVCAVWHDGLAYRPKHKRDPKGVWHSWGKHANWFKKLILSEGDGHG